MANPANITLRSVKGSFLTFEEMDLNMTELQNIINEYNSHVNTAYANHVTDFNALQSSYNQYVVDNDNRVAIVEQDIVDINNDQTVQDTRLTQNESDITSLELKYGLDYKGNWDTLVTYSKQDVVTYTDGLDYISIVDNNTIAPVSGSKTANWVVFNAKSVASFTSYDNSTSGLTATTVQDAIDELRAMIV